ncbi:alpha/beta hydrolase [Paracoccus aestuariivivens]|uniref:Alpha/beta hydrolase n=1 Tax=Paracoccus aestuariivivens TaxID=1820333 RepID=A0A6L6JEJ4_9RHOB|nr:alpha/beta hydrolase [Paracoccus aestuariivivens]MTH79169.1 alpha/beta hydrolase [Paracoccus aestuariivivens]
MKKPVLAIAACLLAMATAAAAAPQIADAIPLYGAENPGSPNDEMLTGSGRDVRNVTYPTLTPVLPASGTANGAAVIVAPGGAFMFLSMDGEGWDVARALADQGITAFVLKYRLNPTPADPDEYSRDLLTLLFGAAGTDPAPEVQTAHATKDVTAALDLLRGRADDWDLDQDRLGIIGFSAGAIAARDAVLSGANAAFLGNVYGPMEAVNVPVEAPPLFVALAMDDPLFSRGDFGLATAWRDAGRPVEMHVYQSGGHGFGTGKPGETNALMMSQFLAWLNMQGFLSGE